MHASRHPHCKMLPDAGTNGLLVPHSAGCRLLLRALRGALMLGEVGQQRLHALHAAAHGGIVQRGTPSAAVNGPRVCTLHRSTAACTVSRPAGEPAALHPGASCACACSSILCRHSGQMCAHSHLQVAYISNFIDGIYASRAFEACACVPGFARCAPAQARQPACLHGLPWQRSAGACDRGRRRCSSGWPSGLFRTLVRGW